MGAPPRAGLFLTPHSAFSPDLCTTESSIRLCVTRALTPLQELHRRWEFLNPLILAGLTQMPPLAKPFWGPATRCHLSLTPTGRSIPLTSIRFSVFAKSVFLSFTFLQSFRPIHPAVH